MPTSVFTLIIYDFAFLTLLLDGIVVGSVIGTWIALSGTTRSAGFWPTVWVGVACGLLAAVPTYFILPGNGQMRPLFNQLIFLAVHFFSGLFFGAVGSCHFGIVSGRYLIKKDQRKLQFGLRRLFVWQLIAALVIGAWLLWHRQDLVRNEAIAVRQAAEFAINHRIHPSLQLFFGNRLVIESYPKQRDPALIDDAALREALTQIRDEGVSLEMISLGKTRVTDEIMVSVSEEKQLVYLYLDQTEITDEGLTQIHSLPLLTHLSLADTSITDDGLAVLPSLPRLEILDLRGTKVSDAAVDLLLRCPRLKSVHVERTSITPAGQGRLQAHLYGRR